MKFLLPTNDTLMKKRKNLITLSSKKTTRRVKQEGVGFAEDGIYERSIVLYIRSIRNEGIPGGLYRHTSEIRQDMDIIERKIREIENKLSVRNLVADIIDSGKEVIDESFIESMDRVIEDAERSIFHLERLRDAMNYLEEELEEVRWLMKNDGR